VCCRRVGILEGRESGPSPSPGPARRCRLDGVELPGMGGRESGSVAGSGVVTGAGGGNADAGGSGVWRLSGR